MPLYLDELYVDGSSPENVKKVVAIIGGAMKGELPEGVTIKAGPWASNEEPKVILVVDIKDHSTTFERFAQTLAQGVVIKRRLTPIVEWSVVERMAKAL
jgi:hypothetical protein